MPKSPATPATSGEAAQVEASAPQALVAVARHGRAAGGEPTGEVGQAEGGIISGGCHIE